MPSRYFPKFSLTLTRSSRERLRPCLPLGLLARHHIPTSSLNHPFSFCMGAAHSSSSPRCSWLTTVPACTRSRLLFPLLPFRSFLPRSTSLWLLVSLSQSNPPPSPNAPYNTPWPHCDSKSKERGVSTKERTKLEDETREECSVLVFAVSIGPLDKSSGD